MTTLFDVPADILIKRTAQKLKDEYNIGKPDWVMQVKTGMHKELAPVDSDWWYIRCASILRKTYMDGPVGISKLRGYYGGKHRRGVASPAHARGSGSIVRKALQQLEAAGLVKSGKKGRAISAAGQSLLDNTAHELKPGLVEQYPGLEKY